MFLKTINGQCWFVLYRTTSEYLLTPLGIRAQQHHEHRSFHTKLLRHLNVLIHSLVRLCHNSCLSVLNINHEKHWYVSVLRARIERPAWKLSLWKTFQWKDVLLSKNLRIVPAAVERQRLRKREIG